MGAGYQRPSKHLPRTGLSAQEALGFLYPDDTPAEGGESIQRR